MIKMEKLFQNPTIKPFRQNPLNPSELDNVVEQFSTGWTGRYNTVQTPPYKQIK